MPATEILELDEPIAVAGGQVTQLTLREPTAIELYHAYRHIDTANHPEAHARFARELVIRVTGLKVEAVDELPESVVAEAASRLVDLTAAALDGFDPSAHGTEIDLDEPVVANGIGYPSLTVRPPKTGEMLKARSHLRQSQGEAATMQYRMSLVMQISGMPPQAVHSLPASAVMKAAAAIELFTVRGRRTGAS